MKKWLILVLLFTLMISVCRAQEDYSGTKGDFKIFVLGDSEEAVKQKVNYLAAKGEARKSYHGYAFIDTKIGTYDINCYFQYFQERLYSISISFPEYNAGYLDTTIKSTIENDLKPMFTNLFGEPTTSYGYPNIFDLDEGYVTFCYKWVLPEKTIYVGISSYEFNYEAKIIISHNALVKAKADFDDQQKQNAQESSKNDF